MKRFWTIVLVLAVITVPVTMGWTPAAQGRDIYKCFHKLESRQTENTDFRITSYDGPLSTAVIAIHGGSIEFGTSELATTVAGMKGYDLYTFEGIKSKNNRFLHVTSTRFDDPVARNLVAKSEKTLSLHGCSGKYPITYIGGLDTELGRKIKDHLETAGFRVRKAPDHLGGKHIKNICNRNSSEMGVQLELTRTLRKSFFSDSELTDTFYQYATALNSALQEN